MPIARFVLVAWLIAFELVNHRNLLRGHKDFSL
jgi:hypothetical protein